MPVRPLPQEEEGRPWAWPQGDNTRLPRYAPGVETVARRGSLRFIRELRLWEQDPERQLQSPSDSAHLCDDDDTEEEHSAVTVEEYEIEAEAQALQPSSVFREGAVFQGSQRVARGSGRLSSEDWGVVVTLHEIDLQRGRCSGDMMAKNVPLAAAPVVTHWEGELIDCVNHNFVTCNWGASYSIDMAHWGKFSAFGPIHRKVMRTHGRFGRMHEYPYIFMRWKERFFVNAQDEGCSLTIAGFYYVCLCRNSGSIEGYYYDPNSTPFQKLELKACSNSTTFCSYQYA